MNMDRDSLLLAPVSANAEPELLADEETLIEDHRASARPAQLVEKKLVAAMRSGPVCLSHLQTFARPHDR